MKEVKITKITPFLRWAGGKQWFIPELDKYLPKEFDNYHEPFLGGGSIFIHLKSQGLIKGKAYLSDLNDDLINSYNIVKNDVVGLLKKLSIHRNEEEYYYELRSKTFRNEISRAAQFIYLNRTSFNGIYRVNLKGKYNVPYGNKDYPVLFNSDNLHKLSELFSDAHFEAQDFTSSLKNINKGDFVFLDPPYTIQHELNGFVKYNQKIFSWNDQERLRDFIENLKSKKVKFILTNAAHHSIEKLYKKSGEHFKISRNSVIGGANAKRGKFNELIFFNR